MDTGSGYGAFRDSEQDLAVMRQYEAFLRLQQDAEGLSEAEYIRRLDQISGGNPSELMQGAEAYGSEDAERMAAEAAVRDATELADKYGYESADGIAPGTEPGAGTGGMLLRSEVLGRQDDGEYQEDDEDGLESGGADGILSDGEEAALTEEKTGEDAVSEEDGKTVPEDSPEGYADSFMLGAMAADFDESEKEADGPETEPETEGTQRHLEESVPSGSYIVPEDEDQPEEQKQGPAKAQPMPAGKVVDIKSYHINDGLDELAMGTGTLAGAVVGHEYVPARPPVLTPEPKPMTPTLAAMYREMQRTDEREMDRQLSGPSR